VFSRRVTVFVGHFGSGKTELAVNAALGLAQAGTRTALVDLDIVKPYLRSRSAREPLARAGVEVIVPEGEHFYADLPIIVPRIRAALQRSDGKVLLDVGGDETGARVLGSLADAICKDEVDHLLVVNFRRPFTETVDAALAMLRDIEATSRLCVTGLVSNTHLMAETTAALVREGYELASETARRASLPLVAVAAMHPVAAELDARAFACPLVPLDRLIRPDFDELRPRTVGPLFAHN